MSGAAAPLRGSEEGRQGYDLGLTSVARHSERGLNTALGGALDEANVCTPRPTSSRVTTV